jgi:hypothetical protein
MRSFTGDCIPREYQGIQGEKATIWQAGRFHRVHALCGYARSFGSSTFEQPAARHVFAKYAPVLQGSATGILGPTRMRAAYPWTDLYRAAIVGTDYALLPTCLLAAKAAIDDRLHELQSEHGGTPDERRAITDALNGLNLLRRELGRL